jgi:hypothetical protein
MIPGCGNRSLFKMDVVPFSMKLRKSDEMSVIARKDWSDEFSMIAREI